MEQWQFVRGGFQQAGPEIAAHAIFQNLVYPGWSLRLEFAAESGEVQRFVLEPSDPEGPMPLGGIGTRMLHGVAVAGLARTFRSEMGEARQRVTSGPDHRPQGGILDVLAGITSSRPGRRGRPDVEYAKIAAIYVDLLATDATPTEATAARLNLSRSQVSNLLHEARRRGLLSKTARGRAGGTLTDKARRLLEGDDHGEH